MIPDAFFEELFFERLKLDPIADVSVHFQSTQ